MQEISKFIVGNWKLILDIVLLGASVAFFIVKKKPVNVEVVDNIKSLILMLLPKLINAAEYGNRLSQKNGVCGYCDDKKQFVVTSVITYLIDELGLTEDAAFKYADFINKSIEDILSTPQKKGESRWPKEK